MPPIKHLVLLLLLLFGALSAYGQDVQASAVQATTVQAPTDNSEVAATDDDSTITRFPEKTELDSADFIAEVEILHSEAMVNRALSVSGMVSVEGYSYRVKSLREWKIAAKISELSIAGNQLLVSMQSCPELLEKHGRYLVVGRVEQRHGFGRNQIVADACHWLIPSEVGVDFATKLDTWFQPILASSY